MPHSVLTPDGPRNLWPRFSVVTTDPMPDGTDARDTATDLCDALPAERPGLLRFVRSLRVPACDVDDVVQEALSRAWRLRASFDATRPLGAWLRKIALRCWLELRERRSQHAVGGEACFDSIDRRRSAPSARLDLEESLATLSPVERELLLRFHRDGLTLHELAAEHAMPLNTVKSHLHRARRRLAEQGRGEER